MSYKPPRYTSVSPYLVVDGAKSTIDFLVSVFNAERLRMIEGDDGRVRHAEVRIDDSVVMIADSMPGWPAIPSHVHVYVPHVDRTYQAALDAGATSVQRPVQKDDPDERGGVKDVGGTTWWISQQIDA